MADGSTDGNGDLRVNRELVRMLEAALDDAKAGRIVAGGVVAVPGPSNFVAYSAFGHHPGEVIAGAQLMQSDVIARIRQPQQGRIVRPGLPGLPGGAPLRN